MGAIVVHQSNAAARGRGSCGWPREIADIFETVQRTLHPGDSRSGGFAAPLWLPNARKVGGWIAAHEVHLGAYPV